MGAYGVEEEARVVTGEDQGLAIMPYPYALSFNHRFEDTEGLFPQLAQPSKTPERDSRRRGTQVLVRPDFASQRGHVYTIPGSGHCQL